MKKIYLSVIALMGALVATAQVNPAIEDLKYNATVNPIPEVIVHSSELTMQPIFIGGYDSVQTTATYGNPAGTALAKQWHDFIGFTKDVEAGDGSMTTGWVSVNHEMIVADDMIGDGGGMTAFKIEKVAADSIVIVEQTLADGRSGKFFNVDFVNTVGPTGMNCGGITSTFDGRIWTAEEWFRSSNNSINDRELGQFVIGEGPIGGSAAPNGFPGFDGDTIEKYQNYNYMVEIDPREAVAVRKQYNWGRQPFEGGVVMPDNQTVYTGGDNTPGYFTKFVAETPGDFTVGTTYVYKEDASPKWIEIDNTDLDNMLNFSAVATELGATQFNRLEWVAMDPVSGNVYMTETGRDNPGGRWADNGTVAAHHFARALEQGATDSTGAGDPYSGDYWDYYGRVLEYNVETEEVSPYIEGGPLTGSSGEYLPSQVNEYKHLSNPDGLNFLKVGEKSYMIINEDLNGSSYGRSPRYISGRICELWLLDMEVENPTYDDLTRIAAVPIGAEVTGAIAIDENTMLVNSQHPDGRLDFPFNNSLTFALHGFEAAATSNAIQIDEASGITVYPNPVSRNLFFNENMKNIKVVDMTGRVVAEKAEGNNINFSNWADGIYIVTVEKDGQIFSTRVVKK